MAQWYSKTYTCDNGIVYKTKFPAADEAPAPRAGTQRFNRACRRAERGASEARHECAMLLNCNFKLGKDFFLTLEYDNAGYEELINLAGCEIEQEIYLAAKKIMLANYLRRCRRACKKAGIDFKYIIITSDLNGKTLEPVRVHHHMVVCGEAAEICRDKWYGGGVHGQPLYSLSEYGDLTDTAEYMLRQVREMPGEKRYTPSRGLRKPKESKPRLCANPDMPLAFPRRCRPIMREESWAGGPQRIRYWMPPKERRRE